MLSDKPILERFLSIQGEGKYIGTLSIFIRFAKCNLRCEFCDTKYSWDEEGIYSIDDIINYIKVNDDIYHIVITGGEPLLYQDEIKKILKEFPNSQFTIETNGSIIPKNDLESLSSIRNITWSVSPKNNECNIKFYDQFNGTQFKYVIEDLNQIDRIPILLHPTFIQPNGFREDYNEACRELVEYIIRKRYDHIRVLPQFHRICWGQKRGI